MHNLNDTNSVNYFIIKLFIKFLANRFEFDIFIFKTNSFCKDIIFRIAIVNNINCAIVFLKRILLITFNCFINFLFNINKDIFNKKKIINVFC